MPACAVDPAISCGSPPADDRTGARLARHPAPWRQGGPANACRLAARSGPQVQDCNGMEKRQINPWTWQDELGFSQAWRLDGAQTLILLAMVTASVKARYRGGFMSANSSVQQFSMGLATYLSGQIMGQTPRGELTHFPSDCYRYSAPLPAFPSRAISGPPWKPDPFPPRRYGWSESKMLFRGFVRERRPNIVLTSAPQC